MHRFIVCSTLCRYSQEYTAELLRRHNTVKPNSARAGDQPRDKNTQVQGISEKVISPWLQNNQTTKNNQYLRNCKKRRFLSRKFANTRSTKALRDYFALAESQPTCATLFVTNNFF